MLTPQTKQELIALIDNGTDLETVDVSAITDMSEVFVDRNINGNISNWNVINVTNMDRMFFNTNFSESSADISNWNVSNVKIFKLMFAFSNFNHDISKWNMTSANDISYMFYGSLFNSNINNWKFDSLKRATYVFAESDYSYDIKEWNLDIKTDIQNIFNAEVVDTKLNPFQEILYNRDKIAELIIPNITSVGFFELLIKYTDQSKSYIGIKKYYTYLNVTYNLSIPKSFLDLINTKTYLSKFLYDDADFYYFEYVDGLYGTKEEIFGIISNIVNDFPLIHEKMIPSIDEETNYRHDSNGELKLVDLECILSKYLTLTYV